MCTYRQRLGKKKLSILVGTEDCSCLINNSVARVGNNRATLSDSLSLSLCTYCFLSRIPYFPFFSFSICLFLILQVQLRFHFLTGSLP